MPRKLAPIRASLLIPVAYPTFGVVLRAPATPDTPARCGAPPPGPGPRAPHGLDAPDDKVTPPAGRTARYTTGARSIIQRDPRGRGERWSLSPYRIPPCGVRCGSGRPFKQLRVVATGQQLQFNLVLASRIPRTWERPGVKRLRNRNSYTERYRRADGRV